MSRVHSEITAANERRAIQAQLSEAMGYGGTQNFELAEEPMPAVEPLSITELTERALRERKELTAARLDTHSSRSIASAEKSLQYPSVTATASAGFIPMRVDSLGSDYAEVDFNVSLPFLN